MVTAVSWYDMNWSIRSNSLLARIHLRVFFFVFLFIFCFMKQRFYQTMKGACRKNGRTGQQHILLTLVDKSKLYRNMQKFSSHLY